MVKFFNLEETECETNVNWYSLKSGKVEGQARQGRRGEGRQTHQDCNQLTDPERNQNIHPRE